MSNGGKGDGHSSNSAKWRRYNSHQLFALDESDLASGVVALGKFDVLHVEHKALAKKAAKIRIPFLLSIFGLAQVFGQEPKYITNLMGHDLAIIVVGNLLMDIIHLLGLFKH